MTPIYHGFDNVYETHNAVVYAFFSCSRTRAQTGGGWRLGVWRGLQLLYKTPNKIFVTGALFQVGSVFLREEEALRES